MPPDSRGGSKPAGFQSRSTPNLPTLQSLQTRTSNTRNGPPASTSATSPLSNDGVASPSEVASAEDNQDEEDGVLTFDGADDTESDDAEDPPPTARPLYTSKSHTQLPPHTSSNLFPPFYNRPPTPLPPSPSLTSLLRPSFSTTTSRPTTPESSDVELPTRTNTNGTSISTPGSSVNLASITKSARHAPAVPRASPKVPTYEYYGFAVYLASSAAFLLYIVWAYVPSPLLHQMGIHYYPNRWWALAVPCWLVVLVIYIYAALASYNTRYLTSPLTSCENLVDECAQIAIVDRRTGEILRGRQPQKGNQDGRKDKEKGIDGKGSGAASRSSSMSIQQHQFSKSDQVDWNQLWSMGTDAVMDIPLGGVNEILYGAGRDRADVGR
ncbi:PIG-P-domain-containing protein [Aaosphaeria arxii CBS 175.79]|uniref:PIG-P-domain-containing protein n=1 Tax=Aaosphaeria arxii CBS 175.79 TaxID=1450172 RepID=A0A6A5XHF6_9PLEO|nr:PIG-P-domain-containing protein [Aaosphaeria arxii CBS 175.79]KAF2012705.1 PIG-P-domain-containing protein [Aaosphaeria arxii CBS 175.79]